MRIFCVRLRPTVRTEDLFGRGVFHNSALTDALHAVPTVRLGDPYLSSQSKAALQAAELLKPPHCAWDKLGAHSTAIGFRTKSTSSF